MRRRQLLLLVGSATSGAMAVGTGAFSSVSTNRGVTINVEDDNTAYLGIGNIEQSDGKITLNIENRFTHPIELTDKKIGNSDDINITEPIEKSVLKPEHSDTLKAECSADGTLTLEFIGTLENSDRLIIEAERSYEIECSGGDGGTDIEEVSVEYIGGEGGEKGGNAKVDSLDENELIRVYYLDNGISVSDERPVGDGDIRGRFKGLKGNAIVGVEIDLLNKIFVRPGFNKNTCKIESSSDGLGIPKDPDDAFGSCTIND